MNDQFDQQITVSQAQALRILSGSISLELSKVCSVACAVFGLASMYLFNYCFVKGIVL